MSSIISVTIDYQTVSRSCFTLEKAAARACGFAFGQWEEVLTPHPSLFHVAGRERLMGLQTVSGIPESLVWFISGNTKIRTLLPTDPLLGTNS